jgi:pimeloyl-ACP methyl ester carboxylesterase
VTLERVDVGQATLSCLVEGEGPVVICAHGFPDCARSFRHQVPALVAAGFRVVAPYLRGYWPSSLARDGRYDPEALAEDLCALARHFSEAEPVRLVGHDWGAIAAYVAVARAPRLFSQLCTLAVPHLRVAGPRWGAPAQLRRSWYAGFFQLRGLAERCVRARGFALIDWLWRSWSPGWTPPADELSQVKASLGDEAHLSAVLGYYRALLSPRVLFRRTRALLTARTTVPSLYLHGARDGCVGVELTEGVERAYSAGVAVHRLDGAGHFLHQERPDALNPLLVAFLVDPIAAGAGDKRRRSPAKSAGSVRPPKE